MKTLVLSIFLSLYCILAFSQQKKATIVPAKKQIAPTHKTANSPIIKPVNKLNSQKASLKAANEQLKVKTAPATKPVNANKPVENVTIQKETTLPETEHQKYERILNSERKNNNAPTKAVSKTINKTNNLPQVEEKYYSFGLGLKYGRNLATLTTTGLASKNKALQQGNLVGLIFNFYLGDYISLQPELNFTQRGLAYTYQDDYDRLKTNYIEVPLLMKLSFGNKVKVFLNMGGYGAYWLNSKLENKTNGNITALTYPFDKDLNDGYADNRLDYGAIAGVGVSTEILGGDIFIEGRYTYGLADISKFETKPSNYTSSKNQIMGLSLGYLINF
jgi:Outer membrane protein beta-barrel domain